jgi:hypothetical protein
MNSDNGLSPANRPAEADRRPPQQDGPDPARIERWMTQINRRLRRIESRLSALAGQAADHHEAIGMITTILRDLDDPYGFGASLDERLAREGSDRAEGEG